MVSYEVKGEISGNYDVIVCGGGPSGVAAALSARREGAKTLLIERNSCLGGIWTAGLLGWILDIKNKYTEGILGEILKELEEQGAGRFIKNKGTYSCDVEEMKHYLEQKCLREGVDIRLHTMLTGVVLSECGKKIEFIATSSKSGTEFFKGNAYVDATGDGDLCALAGCKYHVGNENGETQPMSLIGLLSGIDGNEIKLMNNSFLIDGNYPKKNLLKEIEKAGISPTYTAPTLMQLTEDGIFALMSNHEYEVSFCDGAGLTQATMRARDELYHTVKALKNLGGVWKNIRLVATAEQIGVREARRIEGLYYLTKEDVYQGNTFHDAVCTVGSTIDIHATSSAHGGGILVQEQKGQPYQIPARTLIANDKQFLYMAGRCISGDFYAHSNYRLSGNAVMTGAAAGQLAAIAAHTGKCEA